ncbi:hypothetical protein [Curtanaerobium respiraculi]|uniref:hypothetical protein n=1 Tax=Curtanaerobium respiraculi TaxID=2949669 RepID=UPI0024B326B7|nr:hypothetical protein [Curtanaerobium respiraculi]
MKGTLPLTYAVFRYCDRDGEVCTSDVMRDLRETYASHRQFAAQKIEEILMTGVANGILDETRYELDEDESLRTYYRATDAGRSLIRKYIGPRA